MAGVVYTRLLEAIKGIGVDVSQQQGSNVKKLAPKNKSTATKPGILASERDSGGNFGTVLEIFKNEAKYIDSMNDAEQMAFLNNIMDVVFESNSFPKVNILEKNWEKIKKEYQALSQNKMIFKDNRKRGKWVYI